jgi:hypothetical protein
VPLLFGCKKDLQVGGQNLCGISFECGVSVKKDEVKKPVNIRRQRKSYNNGLINYLGLGRA